MPRGAVTLGDLAGKIEMLDIACKKCTRVGRYRVTRLIAELGDKFSLPDVLRIVAADCPENQTPLNNPRCGAYYPGWREHEKLLRK